MSNIGYNLQSISRLKGMRQTQIADKTGIHPASLSKFFNGESNLPSDKLISLLKCLKVTDLGSLVEERLEITLDKQSSCSTGTLVDSLLRIIPSKTEKLNLLKHLTDLANFHGTNKEEAQDLYKALKMKLRKI